MFYLRVNFKQILFHDQKILRKSNSVGEGLKICKLKSDAWNKIQKNPVRTHAIRWVTLKFANIEYHFLT